MKSTFHIDLARCPTELRQGLEAVRGDFPLRFEPSPRTLELRFERDAALKEGGLAVAASPDGVRVHYGRTIDAFRALGRLLGARRPTLSALTFTESPQFATLGVMLDVSRNAVLRVETVKTLIRRMSLMGINTLMLYAEDVYEVPGEPFFGYMRGCYSFDELREMDRHAELFGMEMIPCIQTLGHMEQVLKWPAYAALQDVPGVLLAGEKKTYALLERMIRAASTPFRSKRIHIGMDEAHGLGTGGYRRRHGERDPFDIFCDHLQRTRRVCAGLGLRPMIWSDMFFRLGSKSHDYYDLAAVVPPTVAERIPKDVQLVYWDYYHQNPAFYAALIDSHRRLGCEPVMAGGIWTWGRFWAQIPFSSAALDACMRASKAKKVKEAFVTIWGDDGMECDLFSALPAIQRFAEHGYAAEVEQGLLRDNFRGSCDADFDLWRRGSELDAVPGLTRGEDCITNLSKWLLWEDPMLGLLDKQVPRLSLARHYAQLADALMAASRGGGVSRHLAFPARLAGALALKANLRNKIVSAYRKGDRGRLRSLLEGDLAAVAKAVQELRSHHRDLWFDMNKPWGWEVLDLRYGGLLSRLDTLSTRLRQFVAREIDSIPELEASPLKLLHCAKGDMPYLHYASCVTAGTFARAGISSGLMPW